MRVELSHNSPWRFNGPSMIMMTPNQLVSTVRQYPIYMIGGLTLIALDRIWLGFGIFTGFMAVWTGACAITFENWHSDRELWRQAAVFLFFGLIGYLSTLCMQITGIFQQANGVGLAIDVAVATTLATRYFRFVFTIVRVNWMISKSAAPVAKKTSLAWDQIPKSHTFRVIR